jgi:hypothetical protein
VAPVGSHPHTHQTILERSIPGDISSVRLKHLAEYVRHLHHGLSRVVAQVGTYVVFFLFISSHLYKKQLCFLHVITPLCHVYIYVLKRIIIFKVKNMPHIECRYLCIYYLKGMSHQFINAWK